jgi:hypothetical protein
MCACGYVEMNLNIDSIIEKYHRLFAEILIMQSLRSRNSRVSFRQKITDEEMARIRIKARETMDKVIDVFKQLPDQLILVLRYFYSKAIRLRKKATGDVNVG